MAARAAKYWAVTEAASPSTAINTVTINPGKATLSQQNRTLQVSVTSESKLEIIALNGKTFLTADVNGNSSISLKKIPNGRYIAKVTDMNGKQLLKKAIAIK